MKIQKFLDFITRLFSNLCLISLTVYFLMSSSTIHVFNRNYDLLLGILIVYVILTSEIITKE
jgi:hypothetical protein